MPTLAELLGGLLAPKPMGDQYGLNPAQPQLNTMAPYGMRHDGSMPKGKGLLGMQPTTNDFGASTEISAGMRVGGKEREVPLMVPSLTQQELALLLRGGQPTESIYQKAQQYAQNRLKQGLGVFASPGEMYAPVNWGQSPVNALRAQGPVQNALTPAMTIGVRG